MAINNEPAIARSDRFTRTISYLPFAVRASDLRIQLLRNPDSHEALTCLHIPKKKGAVELNTPVGGDASLNLAHQLIAARLSIANGSDPTPVSSTLTHADSLLSMFSGKLPYHVKPSSAIGQMMVSDANTLDNYNNGLLTPGCSGN